MVQVMDEVRERGEFAIFVTRERDRVVLAGAHSDDGFCWCQPRVTYMTCSSGHLHARAEHFSQEDAPRDDPGMDSAILDA